MKYFFSFFLSLFFFFLNAQQRIDSSFPFQSDPAKKYSIYIPSSYNASINNKLMLGLHPLNTNRWDAEAWCDTLVVFAEENELLLVCPDGGADGAIDDPIDTAFTSVLLDSMAVWYSVDASKRYIMGFSWGGKTTYTYGLRNAHKFAGFMPIGAAISGISEISSVLQNAENKPFFLVHGSNDSPNTRFYLQRTALIDNNACLSDTLLSGVGHTIDFPNRNAILTKAFQWLEDNSCTMSSGTLNVSRELQGADVFPRSFPKGTSINPTINFDFNPASGALLSLWDLSGRTIFSEKKNLYLGRNEILIRANLLSSSMYVFRIEIEGKIKTWRISIQ